MVAGRYSHTIREHICYASVDSGRSIAAHSCSSVISFYHYFVSKFRVRLAPIRVMRSDQLLLSRIVPLHGNTMEW